MNKLSTAAEEYQPPTAAVGSGINSALDPPSGVVIHFCRPTTPDSLVSMSRTPRQSGLAQARLQAMSGAQAQGAPTRIPAALIDLLEGDAVGHLACLRANSTPM